MEWISVEDKLPPDENVLLFWRPTDYNIRPFHNEIIVGSMRHKSRDEVYANGRYYNIEMHITHWMPLPTPPTNDK